MIITVSTSTATIQSTAGKIATFPQGSIVVRKVSNTQVQIDCMFTNDLFLENIVDITPSMIADTGLVAPTANEDSGDGFIVGDIWHDTVADLYYQTSDVTLGAAVWNPIDLDDVVSDYTRKLVEYMNGTTGIFS